MAERQIQSPERIFETRLMQMGLTQDQARAAMQFLQQMRAGPAPGQDVMQSFLRLPPNAQMAVNQSMQMWNAVAPDRRRISDLSQAEIQSITSQPIRSDVIPSLPHVIVRTGQRAYEIYSGNDRYKVDLDRNPKFLATIRQGLEFGALVRGEQFRDITSPQNPADQFTLNMELSRFLLFLQPEGSVLRSIPRRSE